MMSGVLIGILLVSISKPLVTVIGYMAIDFCISGIADQMMNKFSAYGGNPMIPLLSILISAFFAILLLISFIAIYLYAGLWTTGIMQKTMRALGSDNTVSYRTLGLIIPLAAFVFAFYFVEIDFASVWTAIDKSEWKRYFLDKDHLFYYIPQALAPLCFFIGVVKKGG